MRPETMILQSFRAVGDGQGAHAVDLPLELAQPVGLRRLAETHLAERKGACRACDNIPVAYTQPEGAPDVPSPASPFH